MDPYDDDFDFEKILQSDPSEDAWKTLRDQSRDGSSFTKLTEIGLNRIKGEDMKYIPTVVWNRMEALAGEKIRRAMKSRMKKVAAKRIKRMRGKMGEGVYDAAIHDPLLKLLAGPPLESLLRHADVLQLLEGETIAARFELNDIILLKRGSVLIDEEVIEAPQSLISPTDFLFNALTSRSIVAAETTIVGRLSYSLVAKYLSDVASADPRNYIEIEGTPRMLPADISRLRKLPIFAGVSEECMQNIVSNAGIRLYSPSAETCTAGQPVCELIFPKKHAIPIGIPVSELEFALKGVHKETIGADDRRFYDIRTGLSSCYVIRREMIPVEALDVFDSNGRRILYDLENKLQSQYGSSNEAKWCSVCPYTSSIGIPSTVELLRAMQLRIVGPKQLLFSSIDICDKLIFVSSGSAAFRVSGSLHRFETPACLGSTCLAHHKWLYSVIATTHCTVWELPACEVLRKTRGQKVLGKLLQVIDDLIRIPAAGPLEYPTVNIANFKRKLISNRTPLLRRKTIQSHARLSNTLKPKFSIVSERPTNSPNKSVFLWDKLRVDIQHKSIPEPLSLVSPFAFQMLDCPKILLTVIQEFDKDYIRSRIRLLLKVELQLVRLTESFKACLFKSPRKLAFSYDDSETEGISLVAFSEVDALSQSCSTVSSFKMLPLQMTSSTPASSAFQFPSSPLQAIHMPSTPTPVPVRPTENPSKCRRPHKFGAFVRGTWRWFYAPPRTTTV